MFSFSSVTYCLFSSLNLFLQINVFCLKYFISNLATHFRDKSLSVTFSISQLLPKGSLFRVLAHASFLTCLYQSLLMSGRNTNENNVQNGSSKALRAFQQVSKAGLCPVLPIRPNPVCLQTHARGNVLRALLGMESRKGGSVCAW